MFHFCIEDKNSQYGPFTLNTECLSPVWIFAGSIKAGSWSSVIASVHICCFIITSNPLDLNNNGNQTQPRSPYNNCEPHSSLAQMLFKFMFVLTAYLPHSALHLHYVELKNRNLKAWVGLRFLEMDHQVHVFQMVSLKSVIDQS